MLTKDMKELIRVFNEHGVEYLGQANPKSGRLRSRTANAKNRETQKDEAQGN